jgi:hypothetical protein
MIFLRVSVEEIIVLYHLFDQLVLEMESKEDFDRKYGAWLITCFALLNKINPQAYPYQVPESERQFGFVNFNLIYPRSEHYSAERIIRLTEIVLKLPLICNLGLEDLQVKRSAKATRIRGLPEIRLKIPHQGGRT